MPLQHQQWPGLPDVVRSRIVAIGDLDVHILECLPLNSVTATAAQGEQKPRLIVLLHGFPELAYSWRKVIVPLAEAGYHVVAPDQRGYGLTTLQPTSGSGSNNNRISYEDDLHPYHMTNLTADVVGLIYALGYEQAEAVVGHDFGSHVAGWCAIMRPDVVKRLVLMSAPFGGPPTFGDVVKRKEDSKIYMVDTLLRKLERPRKHYTVYFSTPEANEEMLYPGEGLGSFLRAYYHVKSADWEGNEPLPAPLRVDVGSAVSLLEAVVGAMEALPHYYVIPCHLSMRAAVDAYAPTPAQVAQNTWLTEEELQVYTRTFEKTGFQGGLNRYRVSTDETWNREAGVRAMNGKKVEVPVRFVAGEKDWGTWQVPGGVEAMKKMVNGGLKEEDFVIVPGAGHWVQQERPDEVVKVLVEFLTR